MNLFSFFTSRRQRSRDLHGRSEPAHAHHHQLPHRKSCVVRRRHRDFFDTVPVPGGAAPEMEPAGRHVRIVPILSGNLNKSQELISSETIGDKVERCRGKIEIT
jgi:hypothetical protein